MKRFSRNLIIAAVAAVIIGGSLFANRGKIREAYGRWQRGPIPEAMTREEAQRAAAEAAAQAEAEAGANVNAATNVNAAVNAPAPKPEPKPSTNTNATVNSPAPKPAETPVPKPTTIKAQMNLSVLFVPQAPMKIWDEIHEDTCEEAAMLMLEAYQNDVSKMSNEEMERRLMDLINYQKDHYGGNVWKSTDYKTVLEMMHDVLGLKTAKILPVKSIEDVKAQIALGRPVLLLAAGKTLKNPNFKNGGPLYHGLVAKGYTATTIITNDPGTRLGADYAYSNEVLFDAIHDWNDGDVYNGAKLMIVIE